MTGESHIEALKAGVTGPGDNLGNHTATQDLLMAGFNIVTSAGSDLEISAGDATGNAGDVTINAGTSSILRGGSISLQAGDSNGDGTVPGGSVFGQGGNATGLGRAGGDVSWNGGVGLDGPGGLVSMQGGLGQGTAGGNGPGGAATVKGGQGSSSGGGGAGGLASLIAGSGGVAEPGGEVIVEGGRGANGGGTGGAANITSGAGGSISGPSGALTLKTGTTTDGDTGDIDITTGAAVGSSRNSGALNLRTGTSAAGNVGAILLQPADATGAGTGADLTIQGGRGDTAGRTFLLGATGGQSGVDGGYVAVLGGLNNGAALGGNVRIKAGGSSTVNNGEVVLQGAAGFELVDFGSIGGNTTWNPLSGTVGRVTITGALTFSLGTLNKGDIGAEMLLVITNGGANVTWGASVQWAGGSAPALTAAGTDVLKFTTVDLGASWQAWPVGLDFS